MDTQDEWLSRFISSNKPMRVPCLSPYSKYSWSYNGSNTVPAAQDFGSTRSSSSRFNGPLEGHQHQDEALKSISHLHTDLEANDLTWINQVCPEYYAGKCVLIDGRKQCLQFKFRQQSPPRILRLASKSSSSTPLLDRLTYFANSNDVWVTEGDESTRQDLPGLLLVVVTQRGHRNATSSGN